MGFDKCKMTCIYHYSIIYIKLSTKEFPILFILLGCHEHQLPTQSWPRGVPIDGEVRPVQGIARRPPVSGIPLGAPRPAAGGNITWAWPCPLGPILPFQWGQVGERRKVRQVILFPVSGAFCVNSLDFWKALLDGHRCRGWCSEGKLECRPLHQWTLLKTQKRQVSLFC